MPRSTNNRSPLSLLQELAAIDSATANINGVSAVQDVVERELRATGFSTIRYSNPIAESAELLIGELKGSGSRFITLIGHADTVLTNADGGNFKILTGGTQARGSGVIDDKGGLVVALRGLAHYLEKSKKHRPSIRFVCSPNEEAGSPGFIETYRRLAKDTALALGFEPALENGDIVSSRRGNRWYRIETRGTEGHAGRSRGEHVNAAHELAIKISQLHKLNDPKRGVAVNVARIEGGRDAFNVICGKAECKLDTRFSNFEDRDRLHTRIEAIVERINVRSGDGARSSASTWSLVDDCPPFSSRGRAKKWAKTYAECIESVEGRIVAAVQAGGAGDVNYMSQPGVVVLDGLGAVGGNMHTQDEYIHLPSLSTRSQALASFLQKAEQLVERDGR